MMRMEKIRKRDGSLQAFDPEKITSALIKAQASLGREDAEGAHAVTKGVLALLEEKFAGSVPGVEDVQNAVEEMLIRSSQSEVAKAYILYRKRRSEIREAKELLGVKDDLKLTVNGVKVLEKRYLRKADSGAVVETPRQMMLRVARAIAAADANYGPASRVEETAEAFDLSLSELEFLPNSPTLMNAGTELGQLAACFVLPVEDSMIGIFEAVKNMAIVHQSGGGTGFSFSRLRPRNDVVRSTGGIASGPVSFMRVFDEATEVIKQGGRRRGANMGILRVDHPDILQFVTAKVKDHILTNFNISVAVTDDFMKAVNDDDTYLLVNPRSGRAVDTLRARDVFDLIVHMAWLCGDPGLVFIDEINRHNPTPALGPIESTNPCGEQPLLPHESCVLGSINLVKMIESGKIAWEKLGKVVAMSVHFLDNVVDVNLYPTPETKALSHGNRKLGLGVMGFAELLIMLGIPYDSDEALRLGERIISFITEEARKASVRLAEERGSFPNFEKSVWKGKFPCMRNASLTTIAPTGTISIIAGASSGIEPLFAVSFVRNVLEGMKLVEMNPVFERMMLERGLYSDELMSRVTQTGTIQGIKEIPEDIRRLFITALDIDPRWHVMMQAAFQKYTDNAVSKTVNLPEHASQKDVRDAYLLAHRLKCKGITIFRYGSQESQVLTIDGRKGEEPQSMRIQPGLLRSQKYLEAESEYSGECRTCAG
jgi:ribonucleoside-diphosphate reductase alpha chain